MGHKVYISFKTEDSAYKEQIQSWSHLDYVDKSLNEAIQSNDQDYILRTIREDYLRDSTVTIFIIGQHSAESAGPIEQYFIKRELQASLFDGQGNTKSGLLGVVVPEFEASIFGGGQRCETCNGVHTLVKLNDSTVVKEFSYNYFLPQERCAWTEDDRYCVLVRWNEFRADPNRWIDMAFDKRSSIAATRTRVRPA
ncbi:TIR domain-containing protein [Curtobacterium sp. MCPF17_002]|uniref:TIR domain-containing protein n=1 Tax=Curtobacterium sp. MCPF17_002 TaxID=2175645 RepID=UPI000DAAC824|nr:TIR domain-containing protein [Curtobacterium sp. MCPF17_002]WIB77022.1 TIR domain-containing protein [Curtobacterium sp. MCPF17_002]